VNQIELHQKKTQGVLIPILKAMGLSASPIDSHVEEPNLWELQGLSLGEFQRARSRNLVNLWNFGMIF
jgi:hypothetical protein